MVLLQRDLQSVVPNAFTALAKAFCGHS
jgi:hypothetical protein